MRRSYKRDADLGTVGVVMSAVLVVALLFFLSCAGVQWLIYDTVIGYECSGEGINYVCVPEGLEPEQDATGDEVAPSDPTE